LKKRLPHNLRGLRFKMEFHKFINAIEGPNYKMMPNQHSLLTFIHKTKNCIIYKERQEGVSTAISLYLLWNLITIPNITIGLISHSTQEREIFRQTVNMSLSKLEELFKQILGTDRDLLFTPATHNTNETSFPNGSKIKYWNSTNKNAGRGEALDMVYISELGYNNDWEEIIWSITPCLAAKKDSRLIISSTVLRNLKEGFFKDSDIQEHWCGDLFDGKRTVLFEKC